MFLIFDTETTGLPLWNQPFHNKYQARVIQLGMLLYDKEFREIASYSSLIMPEGWSEIDPRAHEAHGITVEACQKHGMPSATVLATFEAFMARADFAVAYNLKFDSFLMDVELKLHNKQTYEWDKHGICAMLAMTNVCKLPGKRAGQYKWPKLHEAYKHITSEDPVESHEALADCRSTAVVLGYLIQNKLLNLEEFQATNNVSVS